MSRLVKSLALGPALAVVIALVGGSAVAAEEVDSGASEASLAVSGQLLVLPVETPHAVVSADDALAALDTPAEHSYDYSLVLDDGRVLAIEGDTLADSSTGDRFEGVVAVPDEVAATVEGVELDALMTPDSIEGTTTIDTALPLDVAFAVESATLEPGPGLDGAPAPIDPASEFEAQALVAPRAHRLDVVVATGGQTVSDSDVNRIVANLQEFWVAETAGQISSISRTTSVKRMASSCDALDSWQRGAALFGRDFMSYPTGGSTPTHLLVIDTGCGGGGSGLGSFTQNIHAGGVMWASVQPGIDRQVTLHEFGHNIGLDHSNSQDCRTSSAVDDPAVCTPTEYGDLYDVMGYGFYITDGGGGILTSTEVPAALNVTHRTTLGTLAPGRGLQRIGFPAGATGPVTTTVNLEAASATAGTRGLQVFDPLTGAAYYVEYRSGTGRDATSFYRTVNNYVSLPEFGTGVRVLRIPAATPSGQSNATSLALRTRGTDESSRRFFVAAGERIVPSPGIRIDVKSTGATASVAVTLSGLVAKTQRLAGADRYATAVTISKHGFPSTAPVVYLATGTNYPDALAAAPAAAVEGGPLLLTESNRLTPVIRAEIERLKPSKVVIVGGSGAVSAAVEKSVKQTLAALGGPRSVKRIAGTDRYDTGRQLVDYAFGSRAVDKAYVATGANFPDALSAAASAGGRAAPVVLVNGAAALDGPTRTLLAELAPSKISIVGGTGAVSKRIETDLTGRGYAVQRLEGADRYATSARINAVDFPGSVPRVYFATGTGFADALAGAAVAAASKSPLYVVLPTCVPQSVRGALATGSTRDVFLIGGPGALSPAVEKLTRC
ncbi:cell wall-binding repeat-containing protein [Agromyces atrinae]|uniref:Putative cell wall-binding protein n=1 Tax=Agromyces atrinae TaxID=592376 RepID=A0A4Q2M5J7_9MICO|nr:cell wall-binding repeat-containing protein [Agromyces atrinae]NYD68392.1 putative cell wall-binding protein [Agromyces atrinae]RXZ85141.1 hypothetical protein ESP50_16555 [Agromyces atrinae]